MINYDQLCIYIHSLSFIHLCIYASFRKFPSVHLFVCAPMHLCIHACVYTGVYASVHLCIDPSMCIYPLYLCDSMRIFAFGSKGSKHVPRTKNPMLQLAGQPCIQRVLNDSSPYPQEHGQKRLHEDLLAHTRRRCKCLPKSTKILLLLPRLHHAISHASWHPARSTH